MSSNKLPQPKRKGSRSVSPRTPRSPKTPKTPKVSRKKSRANKPPNTRSASTNKFISRSKSPTYGVNETDYSSINANDMNSRISKVKLRGMQVFNVDDSDVEDHDIKMNKKRGKTGIQYRTEIKHLNRQLEAAQNRNIQLKHDNIDLAKKVENLTAINAKLDVQLAWKNIEFKKREKELLNQNSVVLRKLNKKNKKLQKALDEGMKLPSFNNIIKNDDEVSRIFSKVFKLEENIERKIKLFESAESNVGLARDYLDASFETIALLLEQSQNQKQIINDLNEYKTNHNNNSTTVSSLPSLGNFLSDQSDIETKGNNDDNKESNNNNNNNNNSNSNTNNDDGSNDDRENEYEMIIKKYKLKLVNKEVVINELKNKISKLEDENLQLSKIIHSRKLNKRLSMISADDINFDLEELNENNEIDSKDMDDDHDNEIKWYKDRINEIEIKNDEYIRTIDELNQEISNLEVKLEDQTDGNNGSNNERSSVLLHAINESEEKVNEMNQLDRIKEEEYKNNISRLEEEIKNKNELINKHEAKILELMKQSNTNGNNNDSGNIKGIQMIKQKYEDELNRLRLVIIDLEKQLHNIKVKGMIDTDKQDAQCVLFSWKAW